MASDQPIGTRIAKRRQVLGITQEQLAHELRRLTGRPVSPSTVANWERGKHYPQRYLGALEEVLGVTLDSSENGAPFVPADDDEARIWAMDEPEEWRLKMIAWKRQGERRARAAS